MARLTIARRRDAGSEGEPAALLDSSAAGARVLRGGVLRSGGYAATVGLAVLSAALLTRHLGVARFGQYTTIISLVTVISAVTDAGMSNVGVHGYAVREGADRDRLMRDLLGLRIALGIVGLAFALAFALAAGYGSDLLLGTALAALGSMAIIWQHTFTIPLAASLRLGTLSALEVARQLVSVLAIVILVVLGAGLLPFLAVMLVANSALIAPTALLARGQISARPTLRLTVWGSLLRPTIAFSLATALGTIYAYTAQIVTSLVASHRQSGLFAVSFRVFVVVAGISGLLVGGALPLLSRAARDDRRRLQYALGRISQVSLILGVAAALGLGIGARFVVEVIAGRGYLGAVPVLRVQSIALLATFMLAGWSFALLSLQRYRSLLIVNATAFAVSCALTVLLASTDGAQGAALATLAGESTLAVGSLLALSKVDPKLSIGLDAPFRIALAGAAACGVGAGALIAGLPAALAALAALALYALLILATRAAPAELGELLGRGGGRAAGG
jgi:O-antigen/teichoic acid export membrane protein